MCIWQSEREKYPAQHLCKNRTFALYKWHFWLVSSKQNWENKTSKCNTADAQSSRGYEWAKGGGWRGGASQDIKFINFWVMLHFRRYREKEEHANNHRMARAFFVCMCERELHWKAWKRGRKDRGTTMAEEGRSGSAAGCISQIGPPLISFLWLEFMFLIPRKILPLPQSVITGAVDKRSLQCRHLECTRISLLACVKNN